MRIALALAFLAACSGSPAPSDDAPAPAATPAPSPMPPAKPAPHDAGSATDGGPHVASEALRKCAESKGDIGSIADAVARLGVLVPKGGDGPCFIATLPRPLAVTATLDTSSAQPAVGSGSPRLFFMLPKIVITAVPFGDGSKVLELGQWTGTTRTLKGEVAVPVTAPLAADAPFTRILDGTDKTLCAKCHRDEERHPTIANGFVSLAFKPEASSIVALEDLENLHTLCTQADDPSSRCAMIHAVFDFGEVTEGSFSPVVATFLGP